ncbi:hypothetical protein O181_015527 [Austropuccinia psidii MF-1]|uniref:Retrotransposon gag domain-containing protein n=1 Tax=Austropuccinia psidii MF-1 TaxID=1389203 RepID=A0A9Q3GQU8_9BASI|nr:hypothetical protein [Austropuccinia psidii MF-1]
MNICISTIHPERSIQLSSFPNLARYTFHQSINTASSIHNRPDFSLKDSRSQPIIYTSLSFNCGSHLNLFLSVPILILILTSSFPFEVPQVFHLQILIFINFILKIIPFQCSPPSRQKRSKAIDLSVLTPTPRAPLDGTPAVPQLKPHFDRKPNLEGAEPFRKEGRGPIRSSSFSGGVGAFAVISRTAFKGLGEDGEKEEENYVEEEESDGIEVVHAPVGASQGTGGSALAKSNKPVSHQSEPSLLAIMQELTQIMANIQADSSSDSFKTKSMKEPECFYGTEPSKVRSCIQYRQPIFHNDQATVSEDWKKALCSTLFLIFRAAKWIETYLSNLTNQDPAYLLNYWESFESQLFTLFADTNEVRKAEAEFESLRMKKCRHLLLYIADVKSLVSIIGYWGERAHIHHFKKEFPPVFFIN